jgi:hypothetical protein
MAGDTPSTPARRLDKDPRLSSAPTGRAVFGVGADGGSPLKPDDPPF